MHIRMSRRQIRGHAKERMGQIFDGHVAELAVQKCTDFATGDQREKRIGVVSKWIHLHEGAAEAILWLALIHTVAALYESLRHGENLVWAMVTGRKRV